MKMTCRHFKQSMPIKDGFRSPSGELPVANAGVNNLQNVSEGFDITLRRMAKALVAGCCSAIGVNPRQGSVRHTPFNVSNFRMVGKNEAACAEVIQLGIVRINPGKSPHLASNRTVTTSALSVLARRPK